MKKIIYILNPFLLVVIICFLSSCNQVKLSNEDAKGLIIKTLNLPQKFNTEINANSNDPLGAGRKCEILENEGFIWKEGNWIYGYTLHVTDKGKPYLLGEGKDPMYGKNTLKFKAFNIDFNEISGIAINKEQQTATVRFSLKATNVSPISRAIEKNIDNPRNSELVFKKFDNGWQLESAQNKSGVDLVREIWWPRNN